MIKWLYKIEYYKLLKYLEKEKHMKENNKKWWMINSTLVLMVTVFVSFILYVLYLGYLSPRPLELGTIVTNPNLKTLKTNGLHVPKKFILKKN